MDDSSRKKEVPQLSLKIVISMLIGVGSAGKCYERTLGDLDAGTKTVHLSKSCEFNLLSKKVQSRNF